MSRFAAEKTKAQQRRVLVRKLLGAACPACSRVRPRRLWCSNWPFKIGDGPSPCHPKTLPSEEWSNATNFGVNREETQVTRTQLWADLLPSHRFQAQARQNTHTKTSNRLWNRGPNNCVHGVFRGYVLVADLFLAEIFHTVERIEEKSRRTGAFCVADACVNKRLLRKKSELVAVPRYRLKLSDGAKQGSAQGCMILSYQILTTSHHFWVRRPIGLVSEAPLVVRGSFSAQLAVTTLLTARILM